MSAARPQGASPRYGGFSLGALSLALPLQCLREVQPCTALVPLPSAARCVIGGLTLRGLLVPVIDLRLELGLRAEPPAEPVVLVMVHDGQVLGLLADRITGVFEPSDGAGSQGIHCAAVQSGGTSMIMDAAVRRSDTGAQVSVLSPRALASLPGVPMVDDRQAQGLPDGAGAGPDAPAVDGRPVMLMRCGPVSLAIDALAVHATVAVADLEPSPLAWGHCRGVIAYGGQRIGALDLLALCGLGRLDDAVPRQAVILQSPPGLVALLIDEVLDIVTVPHAAVQSLPAFALPRPGLVSGGLPRSALPPGRATAGGNGASPCLLLDSAALVSCLEVTGLAATQVGLAVDAEAQPEAVAGARPDADALQARAPGRRNLITFAVGVEVATPIEQVSEILPLGDDWLAFDDHAPVLGLLASRGRTIPVVCLSRLLTGTPAAPAAGGTVLVVESDGDRVGFAVQALRAIESTDWEPQVRALAGRNTDDQRLEWPPRQLARVGSGSQERLLPLLLLQDVALAVRQRAHSHAD